MVIVESILYILVKSDSGIAYRTKYNESPGTKGLGGVASKVLITIVHAIVLDSLTFQLIVNSSSYV